MTLPVPLSEVVNLFESQGDETHAFVNEETGALALLSDEAMAAAENGDAPAEYPEWMGEEIAMAAEIAGGSGEWIGLPAPGDMPDLRWMREFACDPDRVKANDKLLWALNGSHPFRRFREAARAAGLLEDWFAFRHERLLDELAGWLEGEGIPFHADK